MNGKVYGNVPLLQGKMRAGKRECRKRGKQCRIAVNRPLAAGCGKGGN
jgi:hypothetical protein